MAEIVTPRDLPTDNTIIDYDITEVETDLGITRCYRENEEIICHLIKYVDDLELYKSGTGVKAGKPINYSSKWDLSKPMTADEVVNGNPVQEVLDV